MRSLPHSVTGQPPAELLRLFNILAYITNKISIMQKINTPQYLDYICEDFFEKIIKTVTDDYEDIKEIVDKTIE